MMASVEAMISSQHHMLVYCFSYVVLENWRDFEERFLKNQFVLLSFFLLFLTIISSLFAVRVWIKSTYSKMICLPLQRTSDAPQAQIHWSTDYLQTVPGKIKCICLVCLTQFHKLFRRIFLLSIDFDVILSTFSLQVFLLFGYLCERSSGWFLGLISPLYDIVFWFAFNITCLLLCAYLFNIVPYYDATPWTKIEYYFCFGTAIALSFCTLFMAFNGLGWITVAVVIC